MYRFVSYLPQLLGQCASYWLNDSPKLYSSAWPLRSHMFTAPPLPHKGSDKACRVPCNKSKSSHNNNICFFLCFWIIASLRCYNEELNYLYHTLRTALYIVFLGKISRSRGLWPKEWLIEYCCWVMRKDKLMLLLYLL